MTGPRHTVALLTGLPDHERARRPEYEDPDLAVRLQGPDRNVTLDIARFAGQLQHEVPPRLRDLMEIAVAVYAGDLAFKRGANEQWVRSMSLLIPVREADFWRSIEPQVAELLYVLSHDRYAFDFCERGGPDEALLAPSTRDTVSGFDCVSLLSGGIDSFAGATALLATGRKPLFVAHRPQNSVIAAAQEHVRDCLEQRFGKRVRLVTDRSGPARSVDGDRSFPSPEAREASQRTRSLLYLSLAAVACEAIGAHEVICPENGVLSINPPLTEARVGGNSTAGTRPGALARFSELLTAMGLSIEVVNPFVYQTKGQLVRDVLRPHFAAEEIQGAVSCWMAGRASRACGGCIPCLVRAIAMRGAGLPAEAHIVDPLATGEMPGPATDARANLVDLMTLARRCASLGDAELLEAYPTLLALPPQASIYAAVGMLRRFANEVLAATATLEAAKA